MFLYAVYKDDLGSLKAINVSDMYDDPQVPDDRQIKNTIGEKENIDTKGLSLINFDCYYAETAEEAIAAHKDPHNSTSLKDKNGHPVISSIKTKK